MSYSVCLDCKEMVGGYQKYCPECLPKYRQKEAYEFFWKSHGYEFLEEPKRGEEIDSDRTEEWDEIVMREKP
jgi:hypothetical protein